MKTTTKTPKQTIKPTIKIGYQTGVYHCSSQTTVGTFYTVNALQKTCSCPAGKYGKACWHGAYVAHYHGWRMQQLDS